MSQATPTTSETKTAPQRRRWFSFRLTTLFLLVTIVAIAAAYPHMRLQVQLWRLQSYVGRDLRTATDSERWTLGRIIKSLQAPVDKIFFDKSFHPQTCWRLLRMETGGETRFVLLQHRTTDPRLLQALSSSGDPTVTDDPGQSDAIVLLYDSQGKLIYHRRLVTGWHIDQMEAKLVADSNLGEPLLCIFAGNAAPDEVAKQYYALTSDECRLVRLENQAGDAVRDRYVDPEERIGPEPPLRTQAEWTTALYDPSKTEILRTLTWLSGSTNNSSAEGKQISGVRQEPAAKVALADLLDSDDAWISEAARLALESINND
ncbi:hypothetical protein LOC68_16280 [Blastopirellula sp. JC732]|uniref:Uncharacterized protein n=1 Tax=Blastopirellula sediminis TaxID=2894196 RepID=A0A9X1SG92_9BACT|nr:hypothetical protein [Blastopirellula sediminis]MCC9606753.1 hypothetical protein [Blastopirellula sediminis]MCC9629950.1 hypothetical protein [Blastopirellula sediminis]